jgi:hypothetical protein
VGAGEQVDWDSLPAWVVDTTYTKTGLESIVQLIVNQGGWTGTTGGDTAVIYWDDHDGRSSLLTAEARRSAHSYDASSTEAPLLSVTYTLPTVTTSGATSISDTSATVTGVYGGDYTGNLTNVAFVWDTSTHVVPGDPYPYSAPPGLYANYYLSGTINYATGQQFSYNIPAGNLTSCTTYYVRAGGNTTNGWLWGSEVVFKTTGCGAGQLTGYPNRIRVEAEGSNSVTDYSSQFLAFFSGVASEKDSLTQFLYRPAARYSGTHDRTYIAGTNSLGLITISQWDEDDLTLSSPITLWDFATVVGDHVGCSVIILQHQTGDNAVTNGTILVAVTRYVDADYMATRRSINVEDIGNSSADWGEANIVQNAEISIYPFLTETLDGTIRIFLAIWDGSDFATAYCTLTLDPANPDNDVWSAATTLTDFTNWGDYQKPWVDGNDIHLILGTLEEGVGYKDIFYIKWQGSDSTWRTANGTQKTLPFDQSDAAHTPDLVFDSTAGNYAAPWDIKTDELGNPYLVWIYSTGLAEDQIGDIYRSNYSAGWQNIDTGINTQSIHRSGGIPWMAGAELREGDVDTIFAAAPDGGNNTQIEAWENVGGTWYIADGDNGTTAIAGDGKITQLAPGDNIRPITVLNGAGHFEILWFYTEAFSDTGPFNSMRIAWPGFSNQNYLCLNKESRADFGDLRMTQEDGETLQPSASDGKPWIQSKTDSFMAALWWDIGNVSFGITTDYVYFGNSTNTNANTQSIMDANFPLGCDHFDTASLDAAKWALTAGTGVTQASSNLILTAETANYSKIYGNTTTYPAFQYAEFRVKFYTSDSTPGTHILGLGTSADTSYVELLLTDADIYRVTTRNRNPTNVVSTNLDLMAITVTHIWRVDWQSDLCKYYNDIAQGTNREVNTLQATHTTFIPTASLGLSAWEGQTTGTGIVYVDWIFARSIPSSGALPTIRALTQEIIDISNIPSTWDVGVVQPSQTYWANGAEPGWPLVSGNCTGNASNLSSFTLTAITVEITDFTNGTTINIVSTPPGVNEVRMMIFKSGAGNDTDGLYLTNVAQDWATDVAADESVLWELKLETGTSLHGGTYTSTLTFSTDPAGDSETVTITFAFPHRGTGIGIGPAVYIY